MPPMACLACQLGSAPGGPRLRPSLYPQHALNDILFAADRDAHRRHPSFFGSADVDAWRALSGVAPRPWRGWSRRRCRLALAGRVQ